MALVSKKPNITSRSSLFLIAFVEGFTVLGIELGTAKILNSYYGSSVTVWALVVGLTLLALTVGYYVGGLSSDKKNPAKTLFRNIIIGSLLVAFIPVISGNILSLWGANRFFTGLVLSALLIVVPSLIVVGTLTSLIIGLMAGSDRASSGNFSGKVYGISTLGGLVSVIACGFYLIPEQGITNTLVVCSLVLILSSALLQQISRRSYWFMAAAALIMITFFMGRQILQHKKSRFFNVVYESEGTLGQLKVLDFHPANQNFSVRRLLINGIPQTFILNTPQAYSYWRYPHFVAAFSTLKESASSTLLVGFGGGSVARELKNLGFKFDVVELDKRIMQVAKKYFYFNTDSVPYTIDDARHFIKKSTKKYDLVVFDVLSGEVQPNHVFTIESLREFRQILNQGAVTIINYQGILNDKEDRAFPSLFKTFKAAGFYTYYWATNPAVFEDIIFVISPDPIDFNKIDASRLGECCRLLPQMRDFLKKPVADEKWNFNDLQVLTDDKPILDQLNRKAMVHWRKVMLHDITDPALKEGISLYK